MLVNNAANDTRHRWEDVTPDYWDERLAVNLRHFFFAIQAVAPGMIAAKQGSIINFGSISWRLKQGGMPGYTASKAAVYGLTRGFATDLGKHGIRVNTLEPGWVMTERQLKLWVTPDVEADIDRGQALSGRVMPDDLARACSVPGVRRQLNDLGHGLDGRWRLGLILRWIVAFDEESKTGSDTAVIAPNIHRPE